MGLLQIQAENEEESSDSEIWNFRISGPNFKMFTNHRKFDGIRQKGTIQIGICPNGRFTRTSEFENNERRWTSNFVNSEEFILEKENWLILEFQNIILGSILERNFSQFQKECKINYEIVINGENMEI